MLNINNHFCIRCDKHSFERAQQIMFDNDLIWCNKDSYGNKIITYEDLLYEINNLFTRNIVEFQQTNIYYLVYDKSIFYKRFYVSYEQKFDIILDLTRA